MCFDHDPYFFEEDEDVCRKCSEIAGSTQEMVSCEFCSQMIPTRQTHYVCASCNNEWFIGRSIYSRDEVVACGQCRTKVVTKCDACRNPVTGLGLRAVNGMTVCRSCFTEEEQIWCPKCEQSFPRSGYLRFAFFNDRAGLHAAALVTHYRHEHVQSYDRALSNRHYARKIPNFDYDEMKEEVNNRAKRQLIRAVRKHVLNGTYLESAPVAALDLIRGFERLQSNDDATIKLLNETLARLEQHEAGTS